MKLKKLFARYMRVSDPGKAHAVLSASGSERWLGCPGSVKLSEGIPTQDNESSIRGTNTHTLLQFILENRDWQYLLHRPEAKDFLSFIDFDQDMLKSALVCAKFVWREMERMKKLYGVYPQLHVEKKVELKGVGFGTSDVILYHPFGLLHVIDFKNGKYKVEPEDNTQALYYGVASADEFGWDFSEIHITIVQPNAPHKRGPVRTWKTNYKRLEQAQRVFIKGAEATKKKNAPLVINAKWCWFCPARVKCPNQLGEKEKKIVQKFQRTEGSEYEEIMVRFQR